MDYNISTLLTKMGIPELATKKEIKWQYMDMRNEDNGGFAHAEFDAEERFLTVSLRHVRTSVSDEIGTIHDRKEETFSLKARRIGDSDTFRITEINFDGEDFPMPLTLPAGIVVTQIVEEFSTGAVTAATIGAVDISAAAGTEASYVEVPLGGEVTVTGPTAGNVYIYYLRQA